MADTDGEDRTRPVPPTLIDMLLSIHGNTLLHLDESCKPPLSDNNCSNASRDNALVNVLAAFPEGMTFSCAFPDEIVSHSHVICLHMINQTFSQSFGTLAITKQSRYEVRYTHVTI